MKALTVYFGYGSNLWLQQMALRCPNSTYLGIARLNDYRWIISERGYANVVRSPTEVAGQIEEQHDYKNEVWGLVYSLTQSDEDRLDVNEGVPKSYQKLYLDCDFWSIGNATTDKPESKEMLVYVSKDFTKPSAPKKEYIYRMNMGIKDALKKGVPKAYVDQVLREYIHDMEDHDVRKVAEQQALLFEDDK